MLRYVNLQMEYIDNFLLFFALRPEQVKGCPRDFSQKY